MFGEKHDPWSQTELQSTPSPATPCVIAGQLLNLVGLSFHKMGIIVAVVRMKSMNFREALGTVPGTGRYDTHISCDDVK